VASDSFPSGATSDDVVDGFDQPIPACKIVAVTLPPALDSAFMVSLIAATGESPGYRFAHPSYAC
jgi:hypothetical protein